MGAELEKKIYYVGWYKTRNTLANYSSAPWKFLMNQITCYYWFFFLGSESLSIYSIQWNIFRITDGQNANPDHFFPERLCKQDL